MPERGSLRSRLARGIRWLSLVLCLFHVVGLTDAPLSWLLPPEVDAPPLAPQPTAPVGDATLRVSAVDLGGKAAAGVLVRVFVMIEGIAHFAGERSTDADGRTRFDELPRGEVWLLAYGARQARASARVLLETDADVELEMRPAAALHVLVLDQDDRPVPSAFILLRSSDPLPHLLATNPDGHATFDRLGPPPYSVTASAEGYGDATRTGVFPGAQPLTMRLEQHGALEVTVIGVDGNPAEGATVLAAGPSLWPSRSATTNADGVVTIQGLRSGVVDVKARLGDEVSRTEIAIPIAAGAMSKVELELEIGRMILVHVTDGENDAEGRLADSVPYANVVLAEEGLAAFPIAGRCDSAGEIELGPISPGTAFVSARAAGFIERAAVPIDEDAVEVWVPLSRGGVLVGEVVDDRGFPIDGAALEVIGTDFYGMPIDQSSSLTEFQEGHFELALQGPQPLIPMGELGVMPGPIPDVPREGALPLPDAVPSPGGGHGEPWVSRVDGTFRADPVAPGRIALIVRHPAYLETVTDPVTLKAGEEKLLRVVLLQGGMLEGRVREEDRSSVEGARVVASSGVFERVAYTERDGTFVFESVPKNVSLTVSRPETLSEVAVQLDVKVPERGRHEVDIVLPKVRESVSIRVTDDRGYPIDRVEVRVTSLDHDVSLWRTLFTEPDGTATLHDARSLPLRFVLVHPGHAPQQATFDAAPEDVTIAMSLGVVLHGQVTTSGGRDWLANASVTAHTRAGPEHATTNDEGGFELPPLAPGRVRLAIAHPDHPVVEEIVVVDGSHDRLDVGRIDVPLAGEISGIVLTVDGAPVTGARVAVGAVPTYLLVGILPAGVAITGRDGKFVLRGVAEGTTDLEAFFAELGRATLPGVVVRAGRATERVAITMPEPSGDPPEDVPPSSGSVGVSLREVEAGDAVEVRMVAQGSEAERAGVEPGDVIVEVNRKPVRTIEEARAAMTGPIGLDVVLTLRREGEGVFRIRLRRERVSR